MITGARPLATVPNASVDAARRRCVDALCRCALPLRPTTAPCRCLEADLRDGSSRHGSKRERDPTHRGRHGRLAVRGCVSFKVDGVIGRFYNVQRGS